MVVDRRKLLMGGAGVAAIVLVAWMLWPSSPSPATPSAPPARAQSARPAAKAAVTDVGPVSVKLAELKATREEPGQGERNPFRYKPRPAPAPPKPVMPPPVGEAIRTAPPVPAGPPPPPPIPLKLIGVVERANGVKWAVLTDGKSAPMYGKDGDIIDGRYVIVKIGTESIEMTHADGRGRQVIRLSGQ